MCTLRPADRFAAIGDTIGGEIETPAAYTTEGGCNEEDGIPYPEMQVPTVHM